MLFDNGEEYRITDAASAKFVIVDHNGEETVIDFPVVQQATMQIEWNEPEEIYMDGYIDPVRFKSSDTIRQVNLSVKPLRSSDGHMLILTHTGSVDG